VLTPLVHPRHQDWLDHTLRVMLDAESPAFEMAPDGAWLRVGPASFEPHPQRQLYEWASAQQTRRTHLRNGS